MKRYSDGAIPTDKQKQSFCQTPVSATATLTPTATLTATPTQTETPTPTATATPTLATYSDSYEYDDFGRLSVKGGSTYTYGSNHPHAAVQAHGWTYAYSANGDVNSKTNGVETYTFTYTRELKVETISLNAQVLHRFGYDANGNRVADKRQDGTLVYYVGGYYEYSANGSETHTTKYYGSEAMRVDNELRYILSDHLGSTSVVTDGSGNYLAEQRYDAWGLTRYMDGVLPTDKEYTGQRHSRDVGLYDYKARWYDPLLGRFLMEDTIIPPEGVMKLDRYSGMRNNPILFTDPTGNVICNEDGTCYADEKQALKLGMKYPLAPYDLDDNLLSDEWISLKTQISGEDMEDLYRTMWHAKDGYWWDTYGADGVYDPWDFGATILQLEASTLSVEYSNNPDDPGILEYIEGLARASNEWDDAIVEGKPFACDVSTPECAFNWIASYSQSLPDRYWNMMNNGLSVLEAFPEPEYSSYIELSLEIVSKIRNPGSWTGWAYGAPMAPGNMSNIPRQDLIEQAKAAGYAHFLLTGKNPIIIPIGCGWYYLNGVDEKYLPSVCPQWP